MHLLLSPGISMEMLAFAHKLMVSLAEHFGHLCERGKTVNVRHLIHLCKEYRLFRPLDLRIPF